MPTKTQSYVRFLTPSGPTWGFVDGENAFPIMGPLLGEHTVGAASTPLKDLKLLAPAEPPKIICVGLNYRDHIDERSVPSVPQLFHKPITTLQDPGEPVYLPEGIDNVHHEGELVLLIGKTLRNADENEAETAIWGVTCGNDISERNWQMGPARDVQWWRAKGCDTFGPVGPVLVRGLNFNDLELTTRLNGKVVQHARTSKMIFGCARVLSHISRYMTLTPGDLVFMGTPGQTQPMQDGDVVEVEIEGIGVLRNPIKAQK